MERGPEKSRKQVGVRSEEDGGEATTFEHPAEAVRRKVMKVLHLKGVIPTAEDGELQRDQVWCPDHAKAAGRE